MSATMSNVTDAELFSAAKRAYPAREWSLNSSTILGAGGTEWSVAVCIGRHAHERHWKVVARGWSRSELLLKLIGAAATADRQKITDDSVAAGL